MRELSDNKRIIINLVSTIIASLTHAGVSFFLSPFVVETIGVEAQGFVQLSANFTSYAALITIALNSMSGRFLSIAVSRNDMRNAEKYYTSVFYGNIAIVSILLIPLALCVINLDGFIDIPANLVADSKMLFGLVFFSFLASTVFSLWSNTYYITNRIYLNSLGSLISTIIMAVVIYILFAVLPPKMYYSSVAAVCSLLFTLFWNLHHKNRLLPGIKSKRSSLSLRHLTEVISSGVWRTVMSVGEMLLSGLDLLICNLLINPVMMGVLALSKTLPTVFSGLTWQMSSTFAPQLTISYAKGNYTAMLSELRKTCKISAVLGTIPISGLVVYGREFFSLWVPSQDSSMLQTLSVLGCVSMLAISGTQPVGNIFATVNKVKSQAICVIISGVINTIIVFVCLRFTNLGVYAIAGVSTVIMIIRNLGYTLPTAARYVGVKWNTFYYGLGYSLLCGVTVIIVGVAAKHIVHPDRWVTLVLSCAITVVLSLALNILIVCDKNERNWMLSKFTAFLRVAKS